MSKQIDPLRKAKYKQSRIKGNSIRQGLRDAGYTEASASHSSELGVVKCIEPQLIKELEKKDITVDWVLKQLTSELTKTDCKASDRIRVNELLGKWLNMFRDNNIQQNNIFFDSKAEQDARRVLEPDPIEPSVEPIIDVTQATP